MSLKRGSGIHVTGPQAAPNGAVSQAPHAERHPIRTRTSVALGRDSPGAGKNGPDRSQRP
eukprot:8654705-Pyramimonas_sp.AAC.1